MKENTQEINLLKGVNNLENYSFADYTMLEIKKEDLIDQDYQLLPLPYGALEDGALHPQILPDIMSNLNRVCDYAYDQKMKDGKMFKSRNFMLLYEIRTTYLECLHSIETHKIDDSKIISFDYARHIIESKMNKLGIDVRLLPQKLKDMQNSLNKEFFYKCLQSGEEVVVSKGVIVKSILDNEELDLEYLSNALDEGNVLRGDFDYDDYCYSCYILNEQQNNRVALDFETVETCDEVFHRFTYLQGFKKLPERIDQQISANASDFVTAHDYVAESISNCELCKKSI